MNFSDNAMTAILLCSYLGVSNEETLKPLTMKEWNEFLDNVTQHGEQPSVVIHSDTNFFKETGYNQEFTERMKKLLSRGGAVAFALDELTKKGIDIVTLSKGQMNIWLKQLCQDSQLQYVNGRYTTLPSGV